MQYERFEDLPVWKLALDIAVQIYHITRDHYFAQPGDLRDQLRRATLSISNNIAEGFERGSTAELLAFLYIARGSAGEVRSMLRFLERMPDAIHLKSEISNLISTTENCARQLRGWAEHLQNSEIKGQRHLNNRTRTAYDNTRQAQAFEQTLQDILREAKSQRNDEA